MRSASCLALLAVAWACWAVWSACAAVCLACWSWTVVVVMLLSSRPLEQATIANGANITTGRRNLRTILGLHFSRAAVQKAECLPDGLHRRLNRKSREKFQRKNPG